jgi:hypothetical protein
MKTGGISKKPFSALPRLKAQFLELSFALSIRLLIGAANHNNPGSGWRTDAAADLGDHTIAQQYYISLDHPRAVEDPDVPDQCVRAVFAR